MSKQLKCVDCGPIEEAFFDGYSVGDTLLEGVIFRITVNGEELQVQPKSSRDDSYLKTLNKKKWIKAVREAVSTDGFDEMECSKCKNSGGFVTWE